MTSNIKPSLFKVLYARYSPTMAVHKLANLCVHEVVATSEKGEKVKPSRPKNFEFKEEMFSPLSSPVSDRVLHRVDSLMGRQQI
jgi:hypothetical protein